MFNLFFAPVRNQIFLQAGCLKQRIFFSVTPSLSIKMVQGFENKKLMKMVILHIEGDITYNLNK